MNKSTALVAFVAAVVIIGAGQAHAESPCTFNGRPRWCEPNQGYRNPLTQGSDLDIRWADGDVTTIKFLGVRNGPSRKGDRVLINGSTPGTVMYQRDVGPGLFEIGIRSSTGNTFSVTLGD